MFRQDNINDNYGSENQLYLRIDKFIPKNKIIYEPFYLDGKSGECLKNMNCKKIIHQDIDFFTNVDKLDFDIIVSNIPFSKRRDIFNKLFEVDKPFIIACLPGVLSCKWFLEKYGNKNLQLIIPHTRSKCYNPDFNKNNYTPPHGMYYYCYKMGFESDLNFIK